MIIQLTDFADHRLWKGNHLEYHGGHQRGSASLPFMGDELKCQHRAPYDNVRFNIPRATFDGLQLETDGRKVGRFNYGHSVQDPTLFHLAQSVLPALTTQGKHNHLFLDCTLVTLCNHVMQHYGGIDIKPGPIKLTAAQVNRAKDVMAANLASSLSIEEVATECSLSRSHFSRAFTQTVGMPPREWVQKMRLERAKSLLLFEPPMSIAQVAVECGYTDQPHLNRHFKQAFGVTPGVWRNQHRS